MKFRKKSVVIDAYQVPHVGRLDPNGTPAWLFDAVLDGVVRASSTAGELVVKTLDGAMRAVAGDWLIRGVKGELYPCKPDIFEAHYERVEECEPG